MAARREYNESVAALREGHATCIPVLDAEETLARVRPIRKGSTAELRAFAEMMRDRFGVMEVSSAELIREAREEGTTD